VDAIIQHTGRYGTPAQILTDNGAQYIADVTEELCQIIDTDHTTILPYSHEENSIVERANKEVMRHLRAIIFDKKVKDRWSSVLPLVQRIMNASTNATIGTSPASIIYGNSIDLDRSLMKDHKVLPQQPLSVYMQDMIDSQTHIIKLAQQSQQLINDQYIARKSIENIEPTAFPIGSYVLEEHQGTQHSQRPDKTAAAYKGPFRVVANDNNQRYSLQSLIDLKLCQTYTSLPL
jgi:hypothetical protein